MDPVLVVIIVVAACVGGYFIWRKKNAAKAADLENQAKEAIDKVKNKF